MAPRDTRRRTQLLHGHKAHTWTHTVMAGTMRCTDAFATVMLRKPLFIEQLLHAGPVLVVSVRSLVQSSRPAPEGRCCYPHSTDEETEARKESHGLEVAKAGRKPRQDGSRVRALNSV